LTSLNPRRTEGIASVTLNERENHRLAVAVDRAVDFLERLPELLTPVGDVQYFIHNQFADRAVSMARYLRIAVSAVRQDQNSPGYALLRCAMEHHLLDHLLVRADRYFVEGRMPKVTYERWMRQWRAAEPGTEHILDLKFTEKGGDVGTFRIVLSGPHVKDDEGVVEYGLSAYYGYLAEYDPLHGPQRDQRYLIDAWGELATFEERARRHKQIYDLALRWKSICGNLVLNGLYSDEEIVRLNVHYRFLSGFVHPIPSADQVVQRQASSSVAMIEAGRPHAAWELGHLYAAALAGRELGIFLQMADSQPPVELAERAAIEAAAAEARTAARHLWFPGDPPHPGDLWRRKTWAAWRQDEEPAPEDVGVEEPYYRDPFERLKELHRGGRMGSETYTPAFFLPLAD
jgi:hypothetical protein